MPQELVIHVVIEIQQGAIALVLALRPGVVHPIRADLKEEMSGVELVKDERVIRITATGCQMAFVEMTA